MSIMTTDARPRSFRSAVAAWEHQVAAVVAEPCDVTQSGLCALLDTMDKAIVRSWQQDGHAERLRVFRACRVEARRTNRLVTAAALARARERATKGMAARMARGRAPVTTAGSRPA